MKKHFTNLKVAMTLLLLCGVCSAWGEEVTLASWTFTSGTAGTNYPSNKTNFSATEGSCTGSTFYLDGSGSTWNDTKGYAFTAVTSITITIKASEAIAKGTKITFKVTTYYNKASNAPMKGFNLTCNEGSGSFGTTGLSATSWSLSNSSAEKTVVYTTQNDITKDGTIALKLTQTGKAGSGQGYMGPIVVTSEAAATEPCTVTFNAGTNGTCTTTSLTEASVGAGVTLPDCTPNAGYVFKGWSTTATSTTADAGEAGASYKPTSDCILYAVYNKLYTITIITPENGTLIVMNGETPVASDTSVEEGTTLTIEATPSTGYKFQNWQYKKDLDGSKWVSNSKTFTYTIGSENVSFTANFEALQTFTINYMVNGVNTGAQENVYEETALEFPTVNDFGGKVFVGWSVSEISTPTNEKPTYVETAGLTATTNATYYAVFANLIKGVSKTYTDVINHEFAGVENQDDGKGNLTKVVYTDWSGKTGTSGAVYAGQTAGDNNSVQMRSNNNNSGIITTTSGGRVKSVTVEWNSETASGRTINIYGKSSAYASPTELYNNTASGDLIGTIVNETSTSLNITDDYEYIGFRSNSGAMYLTSISIVWEQGTPDSYSDYCTTVTPQTQNVTITSVGWATACIPFNATITSENATAYYVKTDNAASLVKTEATVIPAGEGILLKSNNGGEATVTFTESAEDADEVTDNYMKGSLTGETFSGEGKYYILANDATKGLGFYWQSGTSGTSANCGQNKAVLVVPASSPSATLRGFSFGDATQIENVNAVEADKYFDLMGREVLNPAGGIYILNGKKVLVK